MFRDFENEMLIIVLLKLRSMGKRKKNNIRADSDIPESSKKSKLDGDTSTNNSLSNKLHSIEKTQQQQQQQHSKVTAPPSISKGDSVTSSTKESLNPSKVNDISSSDTGSDSTSTFTTSKNGLTKAHGSSNKSGSLSTPLPKLMVPRTIIASGLVPRQIARTKTPLPRKPTAGVAGTSSTKGHSSSQQPTSVSTTQIFRAKDITSNQLTSDLGQDYSERPVVYHRPKFRTFMRDHDSQLTLSTSSDHNDDQSTINNSNSEERSSTNDKDLTTASAQVIKTTVMTNSDTIIRAERIIAHLENRKGQFAYPYGNYPNYYEKRTQEQKAILPSSSEKSKKPDSIKGSSHNKKVKRWNNVPSVLLPCTAANKKESISLSEFAKGVDLRLEFLKPSWFRGKRVLDIGCNSALLTVFIALHYKPQKIQGVDIDPSLIGKAQTFIMKTFSQLSPESYTQSKSEKASVKKKEKKRHGNNGGEENGESSGDIKYEAYFPKALHRIHGLLPVPEATPKTQALFPHNIEFRIVDWVTEQDNQEANSGQWDVILGFSLTKWIHLHHGDEGIKGFFKKVYNSLSAGGIFLLESQAFDTYSRRSKITKEMEVVYKSIEFRPDQFKEYLLSPDVGFKECILLGHSEGQAKNFNRDIYLYRK